MAKIINCWLLLFWPLCCLQALSLESLVAQSSIYYLSDAGEELSPQVETIPSTDSVKLIVHGFLGSHTRGSVIPLRNAYRAQGFENVLIADWSPAAGLDYPNSRRAVAKVAVVLAKQLQLFLAKHSVSYDVVHVVGHSLGAHIAGRIGVYFNGTLGRITGLDPALPLFTARSEDSLLPNAARFVDVIHTDYPVFGDLTPRGHVDFYPNFGHTPQPGCDEVDLLSASRLILEAYSCSHNRAVLLFAESVGLPKSFPAIPCGWKSIRSSKNCWEKLSSIDINSTELELAIGNMDDSQVVYMGEHVSRSAISYYYLETNDAPPFGQGMHAKFN